MSNYARYRDWHMVIGLVLLIPLSVIAATGLLWNHEEALGLKPKPEKSSENFASSDDFLPFAASRDAWKDHSAAIESAISAAVEEWGEGVPLDRIELKQEPRLGLVVKVKAPESADVRPYEIVWSVRDRAVVEKKGDPRGGLDWAKVVHDLHTGRFFSKQFGFLWSDSGAVAILALGITGVVLYLIPVMKKRAKRRKAAAAQNPPSRRVPALAAVPASEASEGSKRLA